MSMYGLLNIDKPPGKTSRDAVNHVQRLVRPEKVGHAGTLDPLASGVLVLCLGPATRLIQYVQQLPKRYTGTFQLGRRSDSDDVEGEVVLLDNPVVPTLDEIHAALPAFLGTIQQRPPIYSAIKVAGRRSYDLARAGQQVQLASRPVSIHDLRVVRYDYPELVLDIGCGSGTYIRSLGRDLAYALSTEAVMSHLVRTAIGDFTIDAAVPLDEIDADSLVERLLPVETAVRHMDSVTLTLAEIQQLGYGQNISRPGHGLRDHVVGFDAAGHLVAILAPRSENLLRPISNLAVAAQQAPGKSR